MLLSRRGAILVECGFGGCHKVRGPAKKLLVLPLDENKGYPIRLGSHFKSRA